MNYIKASLIFIISIFIFLQSCSTDVDINGNWKDIPIVYCVLDQSSETQYIKINKSFLGPHPASEMAKHADSLFYNSNISAYLTEYNDNEKLVATHNFEKTDDIPKQDGYFANDKNSIWKKKMNLNPNNKYVLNVNIDNGRHIVRSETRLIRGIRITKPAKNMPSVKLQKHDVDFEYKFDDGNARVLQMEIVFNYIERTAEGDQYKSVVWSQNKEFKDAGFSNSESAGIFNVGAFFVFLGNSIPPAKDGVVRMVQMPNSVVFRLSAVDENYKTFMEISAPSSGLVQEKPAFTNITGGYGLFASRSKAEHPYKLAQESLDSMSFGFYTKHLGFVDKKHSYYNE